MGCRILFLIFTSFLAFHSASAKEDSSCRARLSTLVCVVSSPKVEKNRYRLDRSCELGTDSSRFLHQLEAAYDSYPPFAQKQLCSLSKIYLEKDFFGNAWSDVGVIAINKNLSDANSDEAQSLSGFDQMTFGGKKPGYTPSLRSPLIKVRPALGIITHTLLHELGHTFDYNYDFQKNGWQKLSWKNETTPLEGADFPLRQSICLNNCKGKFLTSKNIPELYRDLNSHGFVSQLSAVSPMEDFAETFAFTIERDSMDQTIRVELNGTELDPLSGDKVSKKIEYMKRVLKWLVNGPDEKPFSSSSNN